MSDKENKKDELINNLNYIDQARIKRMKERGHILSMLEEFEILSIKFYHDKLTEKREVIKFITLVKYFAENAPTEALKLRCKFILEKYVDKHGL